MRHAYPILDAWGFHKTSTILTWAKDRMDSGYWLRGQTLHLGCARQPHHDAR